MHAKQARLYFNRHEAAPKVWSVDTGDGTVEFCCVRVVLHELTGSTCYDPTVRGNPESPCAWVEYLDVDIEIQNDTLTLRPHRNVSSAGN